MTLLAPRDFTTLGSTTNIAPTTVTADSTANTKGAWAEIISETDYDFDIFYIAVHHQDTRVSATDTSMLLDIGYDASGGTSYSVVLSNLLAGYANVGNDGEYSRNFSCPVYIPRGSAIAARCQSVISSDTVLVGASIYGGTPPLQPLQNHGLVVTYGVTESSASAGTTLPENSPAHTESAWQEITAATTHPHRGLAIGVQGANTSLNIARFVFDVATGASSSEVMLLENFAWFSSRSDERVAIRGPGIGWLVTTPIPEGTRLAVRAQASSTVTDNLEVALYGWG